MLDIEDADVVTAEPETGPPASRRTWLRMIGLFAGVLLLVLVVVVAALFAWPLGSDRLRSGTPRGYDFAAALAAGQAVVSADTAAPQVRPDCRSRLLSHGAKTAKSVLLLHGYTSCPSDYAALAQLFYDRGYNVYVPRAPLHGLRDTLAYQGVTAAGLVGYADDAMSVVAGLGNDAGVVGISGGGVLATWLAEYRPDAVAHLLVLSPFYRPSTAQAPSVAIKPLIVLFGFRVLPDHIDDNGFSFAGLSQYLRIAANYADEPRNERLANVAVAISAGDPFIDRRAAVDIPTAIAKDNATSLHSYEFAAPLGLAHNILAPANLGGRTESIDTMYFDLYEGRAGEQ